MTGPTPLTGGNPRVKDARKLARRTARTEARRFLADGPHAVGAALGRPECVVEVFATPPAAERYAALLDSAPQVTLVDDRAMGSISDAVNPQGLVAVCRFLDVPAGSVLVAGRVARVAICADVRDPGNAGTVLRCADAAGADAVVLAGTSVDPYNPKTVRASAGSVFQLPIVLMADAAAAVSAARSAGLQILAADGTAELSLFDADDLLARPSAWLFGNEAHGLEPAVASLADHRVAIPILGRAESLNLSTAAAVCLYASARARRT